MLRAALLAASDSVALRSAAERSTLLRGVVDRFVAGAGEDDALAAARALVPERQVTLDRLGERVTERAAADEAIAGYRELLRRLAGDGLAGHAEVSVKLSALGQALPADGDKIALEAARGICEAAAAAGTTVTVDMEDHTTTDATLQAVRDLRVDFPWVGAVLQAALRRTEADCADLAGEGSRVRLCKGAYDEPASVAFRRGAEVDASYVRCLRTLMAGRGYPMVASHDPRMVEIAGWLAERAGRGPGGFEHQMLLGVRPQEQRRLAAAGRAVRVYVPYGTEWYPYFLRRLGERPANLAFFLRSFASRR